MKHYQYRTEVEQTACIKLYKGYRVLFFTYWKLVGTYLTYDDCIGAIKQDIKKYFMA